MVAIKVMYFLLISFLINQTRLTNIDHLFYIQIVFDNPDLRNRHNSESYIIYGCFIHSLLEASLIGKKLQYF